MSQHQSAESDSVTHCLCPVAYPEWDNCDIDLADHSVHRTTTPVFFFMPLSHEHSLAKQTDNIQALEVYEIWPGFALIQTKLFKGIIIRLLHNNQNPSHRIEFLPTPFEVHATLHLGGIGTIKNTLQQQQAHLLGTGRTPKELYLAHLTCPVCEHHKGGEKILAVRRWLHNKRLSRKITQRNQTKTS